MEDELSVQLFDRIGKRVYLTESGREFLPFAKQTTTDANLAIQKIRDLQGIRAGRLRIGLTYSLCFGLAPIILRYMKAYPEIRLEVIYNTASELLEMLKNRDLDFVLSLSESLHDEQIEVTDLFESRLCAVVNRRHPMSTRESVSLHDLKKLSLVLPSKGLIARSVLDGLLHASGVVFDPHLEMNDVNILLQLVQSSLYVTVLSSTTILGRNDLKAIPIIEQKSRMWASLLTLKGAFKNNASMAFMDLFEETMKK